MPPTLQKITTHLAYYKLAYVRAVCSMLIVGGVAWGIATATISGDTWAKLSGFDRFNIFLGVLVLMFKDLMSFLDKTMQRLDPDQTPKPPENKTP